MEDKQYYISSKLREAVLTYLTGLVLQSFKEDQRAQNYFVKANSYLNQE